MRLVPIACTALLFLLSHPSALGAQTCPENNHWCNCYGHGEVSSTAPSRNWGFASYNLLAGTLEASHSGGGTAGETSSGIVVQDRYRIVGPPSDSRIPIQVRVHFSGEARGGVVTYPGVGGVCGYSRSLLVLSSGATITDLRVDSQHGTPCASRTIDDDLTLDLLKLPGEEFPISASISLAARWGIGVAVSGTISFDGLPSGYSVQSCQGYTGAAVPVVRRSWGAVKQHYR